MLIISHRGNLNGPTPELENNPDHITQVLKKYHVEVDVWKINDWVYLGHDEPQYVIYDEFFKHKRLWCHAKNIEAFEYLIKKKTKCFYHNTDDYTLTSNGYVWTFPGKPVIKRSIIVDKSKDWKKKNYECYGVCVDYV